MMTWTPTDLQTSSRQWRDRVFREIFYNPYYRIDAVSDLCEPKTGRFQVTKMRSMRRPPVRNIENILQEEVRNVRQVFERRLSQEEGADTGKKTSSLFNIDKKAIRGTSKRNSPSRLEFVHIV